MVTRLSMSIACVFVATYVIRSNNIHTNTNTLPEITPHKHKEQQHHSSIREPLIKIFYNLFVQSSNDAGRVLKIFDEQFRAINPNIHDMNISINSIGHRMSYIPKQYTIAHHETGGEDMTLHSLWEYCQANNHTETKVVYLHSKGSFHPDENNDMLRRFLTEGALSDECAHLPNECDVCSSRMSPLPHPHTSGNMWVARCSYINKLRDPYVLKNGKLPNIFNTDNGCKGFGRYFFEHWVHSHPSVRPCDLYPGREYTWAYENIPNVNFEKQLREAPRFEFNVYVDLMLQNYWYCREDTNELKTLEGYLENRIWNYNQLYNISVMEDTSWYLRNFLNISSETT